MTEAIPEQKAKSEAEKQKRFDYMVKRFQELIGKYDEISASLQKFTLANDKVLEFVQPLAKNVESIKNSQEFLRIQLDANKHEQSNLWNISGNISDKISKRIDEIKQNVKDESGKHERHDKAIHDLKHEVEAKVAKNVHLESYSVVKSNHDRLSGKVDDLVGKVSPLLSKISSQADDMKALSAEQVKLVNDLKSLKEWIDSRFMAWDKYLNDYEGKISNTAKALRCEIDSKIKEIPQPEKPSYDDVKNEVEKKLEPAFLDAKNANLRSGNNEVKITILEKKLENLQLLINKLQLQG